ncbi:bifunctional folylpolyglutamate synthase/dihydrofolate synthase [Flavihumibacter solisilvae]|uniref:Dihydrofolate synthase/folylpolyglutamate synthase n=1 Tax=Flavihumibacter solisilvae TaxID=1349421 RepID=A0A0C1IX93_9BACT|nr:folylpolyglutamate synthase/dihydrofolate synthase family protein [Flavihumibacter solisilvae]KIC95054.1 dihydrofolate synthase [Flavihumibacter solisilvae]
MNYQETIDFLFGRLPMFSKLGADAYKKDLHNIRELEAVNDNPHTKFRSIHVAGTNGKGSTSHMLAAILQQAGYKTGLYTSPHLKDFRERIRINGEMIPENYVVDFTERMQEPIAAVEPSFFELTVSMAFTWFAAEKVDVAIVEVGLGGRLDSTNIVTPEIAVITNIGWDHMNILGDSLEKIAFEKAGIIKEGIPVVIGEMLPETQPVFEQVARDKNAAIYLADQQQQVVQWENGGVKLSVTIKEDCRVDGHHYLLDLPGVYQLKNVLTVIQAIRVLQQKGWSIPESAIHNGLAHTKKLTGLHGRWEQVGKDPLVILDVGHNEDGIKAIREQLELMAYTRLHIVVGMVKDKDVSRAISQLPAHATYYFTAANIPRAMAAEQLAAIGNAAGLKGNTYPDVNSAFRAAKDAADDKDLVLVCGSVFVVGEVNP